MQYMIDEKQGESDRQKNLLEEKQHTITQQQAALSAAQEEIRRLKALLENQAGT